MQRHAMLFTRVASAGLGLVFIALIGCTLWGAATMKRAAARTLAAVNLSEQYELLEHQLSAETSLVRVHGFDPAGSGWNELRPASVETEATLAAIGASGNSTDQEIARQTTTDHERYLDVLLVLFSAIDNDLPNVAKTFKSALHISERMLGRIHDRALGQHQAAVISLANLAIAQDVVIRTTMLASGLGVLLLGVCYAVMATYRHRIETARRDELARLAQASLTDTLTGLGNHRAYQDDLERELARLDRHGGSLTLALIDIDNFKNVNDRSGHIQGDRVLAALGKLLGGLRKFDRSFRLGGDEFAVILPQTNSTEAVKVMDRVRRDAPVLLEGSTISIGVSTADGEDLDAIALRAQADGALYAAKHHGRNSVMTYSDARSRSFVRSTEKERGIRQLIADGRIDVVFQPIWDVRSQSPLGFEALVRPAETYSLAGPQEAFDLAEQMGLAPALDAMCLRAIFARSAELPPGALLFVNVVPETLASEVVAGDALVAAATAAGLSPSQVVIELTERSMQHFDVIVHQARRLQALGFRIALDDTGAGNAGLDFLRRLSVEFVKIDRLVVAQAMTDPVARAIVTGVIEIARAMGSYVIAEGIETVEGLAFVCAGVQPTQIGIAISGAQGYLLGRPDNDPWSKSTAPACALLARACETAQGTSV